MIITLLQTSSGLIPLRDQKNCKSIIVELPVYSVKIVTFLTLIPKFYFMKRISINKANVS